MVNQRELGADTLSFAAALKYVLRQDPDVVLIGELRDLDTIEAALTISEIFEDYMNEMNKAYNSLLEKGVAKEQARMILPLNQYTEVYWTVSFQAIMNFIELRDEKTAQWEIRQYAISMKDIMFQLYPETLKIWSDVKNWNSEE